MKLKYKRALDPRIDMTPMVDVVFLLLIFFTLTFFFMHAGVKINLPRSGIISYTNVEKLEITITRANDVFVGAQKVPPDKLPETIVSIAQKNKSVMIRGDREAGFGLVVEIWDLCKRAGIQAVDVATLPAPAPLRKE